MSTSILDSNANIEKYLKWPKPSNPKLELKNGKYKGQPDVIILENFKNWSWKKDSSGKYVYKVITGGIIGIPEIKQRVEINKPYKLVKNKDYTVTFNSTTGVLTVKGIGNYTGTTTCDLKTVNLREITETSEYGVFKKKLRRWS